MPRNLSLAGPVFALILILTVVPSAPAENPDIHVTIDPARPLYCRSAFMHGYIHGYEEGFHSADLDLQMGRRARPLNSIKEYRDHKGVRYRAEFGDRDWFYRGFRQGFEVGYSDAISGREFRAVSQARRSASGLPDDQALVGRTTNFDNGFYAGYHAGLGRGLHDGRGSPADEGQPACDAKGDLNAWTSQYCEAFARGFHLGYADGYANQLSDDTEQRTAKR